MKNWFFITFLGFFFCGCFAQPIKVNTTQYTVPQLVNDVLVDLKCIPVTNITWRTGTNYGSSNGIGYFENTNPLFPYTKGVILSTGDVLNAPGPNITELKDGSTTWNGDTDLENVLKNAGITLASKNASILEFDFVPFSPNFDFSFLFASEEYGSYQCDFSDAFAFLLTNTVTGVTTNLAVVPQTTIPISVVTIRDSKNNSTCSSENASFFGSINGGTTSQLAPTNFNGQTAVMSASSTSLIPNTKYHIKLVIADRDDPEFDSAIFLQASSFNIGQDVLGKDLTLENTNPICDKVVHTLSSKLNPALFSFAWTFNGNPIGGNTPDLSITQGGIYGLTYTVKASNCVANTDFITVEYNKPIVTPNPVDLYKCDTSQSDYSFNLAYNTPIVTIPDTEISYFASQSDAENNTNPVGNSITVSATNLPLPVWIRIKDTKSSCFITKSFQLRLTAPPVANVAPDLTRCEINAGSKKSDFEIKDQTAIIYGGQSSQLYSVTYYDSFANANADINKLTILPIYNSADVTIYARVQLITDPSCFDISSFKLIVALKPIADRRPNQLVCSKYVLPALINPGNYYSGPNQGLPLLKAGDEITEDGKNIYIYSETATTPVCVDQSEFKVIILDQTDLEPQDEPRCDEYVFGPKTSGIRFFNAPGGPTGGGKEYLPNDKITTIGTTLVHTYYNDGNLVSPCIKEGDFNVIISTKIVLPPIKNEFACLSYDLPPLPFGDYYTYDSVTNVYTPAISPLTKRTELYVFGTKDGCRTDDVKFTVYIPKLGLKDKQGCREFMLEPSPVGEYRTEPNGGGTLIKPGLITQDTQVYTNIPGANCPTDTFFIKIHAPFVTTPTNFTHCGDFLLPPQAEGADYYTLKDGPANPNNKKLIPNVDSITKDTTIYLYKPSTTKAGCFTEKAWTIKIEPKQIIDTGLPQEECEFYKLPPLTNGDYYDEPNGVNPIAVGTDITKTNTIYIYKASPLGSFCPPSENPFEVVIKGVVADSQPTILDYCDSFTFPPLPSPNNFYYDAPDGYKGTGKQIPFGTTITPKDLLPSYYIFYESTDRKKCVDDRPFSIKITPTPVANSPSPLVACDTFGSNDGIFEFDLTNLTTRNQVLNGQTPDANFDLTFYASKDEAEKSTGIAIANPEKYQNDNPFSDSVWVRITNNTTAAKCFDVSELKLIVNPLPKSDMLPEYFLCEDYETGTLKNSIRLDVGTLNPNYFYEWTFEGQPYGGNLNFVSTTQVGNYGVKITNKISGCFENFSTRVSKFKPYLEIEYSNAFENPTYISVNVLGAGSGNYEYRLDNLPFQDSNIFKNVMPGEYTITARDKDGFCSPAPLKAVIINYPKFFTPNGDNKNDSWNIKHLDINNPNAPIYIFDRYGKFLKQIFPSGEGWNGTYNKNPMPSDDYWFTVHYTEKGIQKIFRAHFSLKR